MARLSSHPGLLFAPLLLLGAPWLALGEREADHPPTQPRAEAQRQAAAGDDPARAEDAPLPAEDEIPAFLLRDHEEDPCAPIRVELARYQGYLERIAAERTSFAYVENAEDATALRLLQAMRRCAEFPDDPDCKAPPIEVELRDREPPRHTFESWPTDLVAEGRDPDEIPHDPRIRELVHALEACENERKRQPLLE